MKNNKKGFTLMEMLIVVAIIAVLVAIAIPVLTGTLEKAREATDAANLRSAYAEVLVCALEETTANGVTYDATNKVYSKEVKCSQQVDGWQNTTIVDIGGVTVDDDFPSLPGGNAWIVKYTTTTGAVTFEEKTPAQG